MAARGIGTDSVLHGGCPEDAEFGGQIVGQPVDEQRVAADRQMRPMRIAGPDRHDEARIGGDGRLDAIRCEIL